MGIMAKPPGPRIAVLPGSFISILADPVTIMTGSVGVCQCHGIRQPAVPLKTMTDAPLDGSPLCTARETHWGSPAIGPLRGQPIGQRARVETRFSWIFSFQHSTDSGAGLSRSQANL